MAVKNSTIIKVFWRHAWKYPWHVIFIVIGGVMAVTADAVYPWVFKLLIDQVTQHSPETISWPPIKSILLAILVIYLITWAGWRLVGFLMAFWETRVMANLQETSFNYLLGHSYKFFTDNFAGSLVRKVNRISRAFERLADEIQFNLLPTGIIIVGATIGLALRFPWIAAAFVIWSVIYIFFIYLASRWKLKVDVQRAAVDSESTCKLSDALTNSATIKLFTGQEKEQQHYRVVLNKWTRLQIKGWTRGETVFAVQNLLMIVIEFG